MKFIVDVEIKIDADNLKVATDKLGLCFTEIAFNRSNVGSMIEEGLISVCEDTENAELNVKDKYAALKSKLEGRLLKVVEQSEKSFLMIKEK